MRRWKHLVKTAESSPKVVLARLHVLRGQPTWRMVLYQRAERLRAYHKRGFAHQRVNYYDSGRIRRTIFSLWRLWARSEMFREACDIALAAREGLHVHKAQPWWEAT